MQKTVLVVDDSPTNLSKAEASLEKRYSVITLSSAAKMFSILEKKVRPDLILLDIEMPELTGFEAMKMLKSNAAYAEIPVIFLTGLSDAVNEAYGIELGAVDFITKPFSEPVLLNRVKNHMDIGLLIHERTEQLVRLQNGIVYILADIVESRDKNTGGHIERTTKYIKILMDAMISSGLYANEMLGWDMDSIVSSARLHDLGKITISDTILNKRGSLSRDEFSLIKTHSLAGAKMIDGILDRTGEAEFLHSAKHFASYHHEWWDGSGYPHGLSARDIPLEGRIMAIVDVYDALTSERPYKKAFPNESAIRILREAAGKQFDPDIADVFCGANDQIKAVRAET